MGIPLYFVLVMTDARKLRSKVGLATAGFAAEPSECEPRLITSDFPAWMDQPFAAPDEKGEIRFPGPGGLAG